VTHQCAWAAANPDKPGSGSGTHCWGWSCRDDPTQCHRKRSAANRAKATASAFRKFPGSAYQQATPNPPKGHCRWCGGGIRDPKNPSALALNRTWHSGKLRAQEYEPDCLWEYYTHTRMPEQKAHLLQRDGPRCACCGDVSGRWGDRHPMDPDRMRARPDPYWAKAYPAAVYVGPFTRVTWASGLEVDHRLALGLVVLVTPLIDRWTWWGPGNLQLLCHACHVAKTKADVAKIKLARRLLAGVAQPALL
jgi:hypothetical protein